MSIDKVAAGVTFTLGGKPRKLVFDMWAFYLLEKETGKNALGGEMFEKITASDLLILTWAAIQSEEKLTLEQVGHMLTLVDIPALADAIKAAFEQAKPIEVKNENAASEPSPQ